MDEQELNVEDILKIMREQIGAQAQEIAILKTALASIKKENNGTND